MIFVIHIWISLLIISVSAPKYQRETWCSNVLVSYMTQLWRANKIIIIYHHYITCWELGLKYNVPIFNVQAWQTHEGLDHSGNDETDVDLVDEDEHEDGVQQTGNPHFL